MPIELTGRQVVISKKLRVAAQEGLERLERVLGSDCSVHAIITKQRATFAVEVTASHRHGKFAAEAENFDAAAGLHEAIDKIFKQATKQKARMLTKKRQPKEPESPAKRTRPLTRESVEAANGKANGQARKVLPVFVHSFPATQPLSEPHVVRASEAVALRPMTIEEAVKEAEFRDRQVFVFRDGNGRVNVLYRNREGRMELIEVP
jgi:putative sigma-54 modulation protein